MELYLYNETLVGRIAGWKNDGRRISFVPTMGALHEGHLSLLDIASGNADITVCSIFVNPTQFNESSDLQKYPRPLERDIRKLIDRGCDILYLPGVEQVYPQGLDTAVDVDLGGLDSRLEGGFRPGHFAGVMQVVRRLLDIIRPDSLVMGQKDYQQYLIVDRMIRQLELPVQLIMGPTVREEGGLAMSSRNERLSPAGRVQARVIYRMLRSIRDGFSMDRRDQLLETARSGMEEAGLRPEYIELVGGDDLFPLRNEKDPSSILVCTAAWLEDIRLIDNMIIR